MLDPRKGLVEYVASDETLDHGREVIRADGWRFTHFDKNAPFVDSHNYQSIGSLLGRVVDRRVQRKQLIETVKWAIDVPEQQLAQIGFRLTEAGYLKAVSVGFSPLRTTSRWDRDPRSHEEAARSLGLKPESVATIFLEQEQLELSACILGMNPGALARAYKAQVLNDRDLDLVASAGSADPFGSVRHHSAQPAWLSRAEFLQRFERLTARL